MLIYSKKIIAFVTEIKAVLKDILSKEIGLKSTQNHFYIQKTNTYYPIKVVVYNTKSMLGYFDPHFYELGFHERLMNVPKHQLYNILRHELAHYLTFIHHGAIETAHGDHFKTFCRQMGWGEEVYRATVLLEEADSADLEVESTVLRKIKKLMALAESHNPHEAELAMVKSQQLLLKHHIDGQGIESEEEKIFLKRIMKQKRKSAKTNAIARILGTFFVSVVYSRAGDYTYLEILGSSVNVEIAEYVADFLDVELDKLWKQAQHQAHLSGTIARNSFFIGIAKGYCGKIHALKKEYDASTVNGVMVIEKQLVDAQNMVYRRLSNSRSSGHYCSQSSSLGEQMGRRLNIHPGVDKNTGTSIAQLTSGSH